MISKLKNIKYVLIVLSILLIGVALWGATSLIIEKSYSSRDVVIDKELEKVKEYTLKETSSEENQIEKDVEEYNTNSSKGDLGVIDYTSRKLSNSIIKDSYYESRISEYNEINGRDVSNKFIMLDSYYYGDYDTMYESDINIFLQNYSNVKEFINSINSEYLENILKDVDNSPVKDIILNTEVVVKYIPEEIVKDDLSYKKITISECMLIGVIEDRYYVYTTKSSDLNNNYVYVVVDLSKSLMFVEDINNISTTCKYLGKLEPVTLYTNMLRMEEKDGKLLVISRGY